MQVGTVVTFSELRCSHRCSSPFCVQTEQRSASWESVVLTDEKEEEEMEKEEDEEERKKRTCLLGTHSTITQTAFPSSSFCLPVSSPRPPPDLPVCAKNISLTANGEKVILWTRYMPPLSIF